MALGLLDTFDKPVFELARSRRAEYSVRRSTSNRQSGRRTLPLQIEFDKKRSFTERGSWLRRHMGKPYNRVLAVMLNRREDPH